MLGVEEYGSGSESEHENVESFVKSTAKSPLLARPTITTPAPKVKRPKKITIGPPSLPTLEDDEQDERPAKKARSDGAGTSSLLSMLPAPKQVNPVSQRVLGGKSGPSLLFNTSRTAVNEQDATKQRNSHPEDKLVEPPSTSFLPLSLAKGKPSVSVENELKPPSKSIVPDRPSSTLVDFFSLDTVPSASSPTPSLGSTIPSAIMLSSAPEIPTFEPPEPTQTDLYPGYYQLPSGAWARHDPTYYTTFVKRWQDEYNAHVRALEKGTAKGFEGYDSASTQDVDTQKEMERAKVELKEREERKALTKGAGMGPSAPKMKMTASKMSGIAKTRHQLSTLLRDAYQNRDALEDKIAEGRRNRKEAGNKYGKWIPSYMKHTYTLT
ncbi:hypothetical protein AX15_005180 [Amanita polypyramis BW_CC]|nr:hypothetical protein AX15_005180 [Amanita polypyramis BW_CC]